MRRLVFLLEEPSMKEFLENFLPRLAPDLIPEFRKVDGARRMGSAMPLDETASSSRSFQVFVKGLRKWINAAKLAVP